MPLIDFFDKNAFGEILAMNNVMADQSVEGSYDVDFLLNMFPFIMGENKLTELDYQTIYSATSSRCMKNALENWRGKGLI